jgi:hypothetical protein
MSSQREVEQLVESLGGHFVGGDAGRSVVAIVDAPVGYRWKHGAVHTLQSVSHGARRPGAVWSDLAWQLRRGLVECPAGCFCRREEGWQLW